MRTAVLLIASLACAGADQSFSVPTELPGTAPLRLSADWREQQRQEILRYLDGRIGRTQSSSGCVMEAGSCLSAVLWTYCPAAAERASENARASKSIPGATATTTPLHSDLQELVVTAPDGFYARALFAWRRQTEARDDRDPCAGPDCRSIRRELGSSSTDERRRCDRCDDHGSS